MADDDLKSDLDVLYDVTVDVTAVLGTAAMPISQVLKLGRGAVVELDRMIGEDIEILANGRLIGHGEVTVIDDKLAITITGTIKLDFG